MKRVFIILQTTLKQGLRRRFVLAGVVLCLAAMLLSLGLGGLSLNEAPRLTVNFGLAAVQISLAIMSVLFGTVFVTGDLEKQTLLMTLVRPITRAGFFFSRWLGLALLILLALCVLGSLLSLFFIYQGRLLEWNLLQALFGFYLESLLLLAFVFFFSSYASSFYVLFYSFSLFIVGHAVDSLSYLFYKENNLFVSFLPFIIPDLNKVNWKSAVVYGDKIPFQEFALSSAYILCWLGVVLSLTLYFFEKREYN